MVSGVLLSLVMLLPQQDSIRAPVPDSLNPDSLRPPLPAFGTPPGPQPWGRRVVFTADEARWTGAQTLGELLGRIPGVFVVRAGWFGTPEVVAYAGQGSASVELYLDGFALDQLGPDSLGFDLGQFNIGLYERIEVEILPSVLRVHLISDTPRVRRPRTEVSFATGDASTNSYRIRYLNRYTGGFGIALGVTYFGTEGPNTSPGEAVNLGIWGKATWTPAPRTGIEYQYHRINRDRDVLSPSRPGFSGEIPGLNGSRTDHFVRAFAATREDGMGGRIDAVFGATAVDDSSGLSNASMTQAMLEGSLRRQHWSAALTARLRDSESPLEAGARASFTPLPLLTLTGGARRRGGAAGDYGVLETDAGASLGLARWLNLHGAVRLRRMADSALIGSDTVQRTTDWSGGIGIESGLLGFDLAMARHGGVIAPAWGYFGSAIPFLTRPGATTFTAQYRFSPWRWLSFSGWYRNPLVDSLVAFEPQHHSVARITFRSMFLPHFRRGAFDVMAYGEVESWSGGTAGIDSVGAHIPLAGKSIMNFHLQFRLVRAILYYTYRNPGLIRYHHVPGYELARAQQRFGIIWDFSN